MSGYHYLATVGFECSNAYKLINRAMNINLKTNYDEYECEDYQMSLDNDIALVYFKEPNKALIRKTMDTIAYALGEDEYCWDLRNQKKDVEVPEIKVEEEEDSECSVISDDDCSSCCECCDISEDEALEILAEYAEEERIEAEKEQKHNDLYKEKYDKMIAAGWFTYHAEFLATCHKFLAIIEDSPRAKMKIIMVQSLYVYIEQNVKIMAFFDEPRYKEQRQQSIERTLNQMSSKIVELKASATEHMAKGNITHITMENLFAVLNSADEKIKETLNILNGLEVNEEMTA